MNRIRELREEKGMSLSALAKELNMTASAIGNYERGEREPKIEVWKKIANYFGVDTEYILGLSSIQNKKDLTNTLEDYLDLEELTNLLIKNDNKIGIKMMEILTVIPSILELIDSKFKDNYDEYLEVVTAIHGLIESLSRLSALLPFPLNKQPLSYQVDSFVENILLLNNSTNQLTNLFVKTMKKRTE